jgi:hypothetical protein
MSAFDLINNYIVMKVNFEFPLETKFPSLPCSVSDELFCYPLKGETIITGLEYHIAKTQGCDFKSISDIYKVPFSGRAPIK